MSESKDITSRIYEKFLKEISNDLRYKQLESPFRSLLDTGSTPKPEELVAIYEQLATNPGSEGENNQ